MSAIGYTFTKKERLTNKILLKRIFSEGSSFISYPFRVVYLLQDEGDQDFPAQMAISVPKKKLKRAPDRNTIKRRTRECYRLNKNEIYEHLTKNKKHLSIFFIYLDNKVLPYQDLENGIKKCIEKLIST